MLLRGRVAGKVLPAVGRDRVANAVAPDHEVEAFGLVDALIQADLDDRLDVVRVGWDELVDVLADGLRLAEHVVKEPRLPQVVLLQKLATDEPAGLANGGLVRFVRFGRQLGG